VCEYERQSRKGDKKKNAAHAVLLSID